MRTEGQVRRSDSPRRGPSTFESRLTGGFFTSPPAAELAADLPFGPRAPARPYSYAIASRTLTCDARHAGTTLATTAITSTDASQIPIPGNENS